MKMRLQNHDPSVWLWVASIVIFVMIVVIGNCDGHAEVPLFAHFCRIGGSMYTLSCVGCAFPSVGDVILSTTLVCFIRAVSCGAYVCGCIGLLFGREVGVGVRVEQCGSAQNLGPRLHL